MKKKKRIKIIIIAVLVVAVAAGSITGVVYYRNSKGLASVMSVSMISTDKRLHIHDQWGNGV